MERFTKLNIELYKTREGLEGCENSLITYFPGLKDKLNILKEENVKLEEEVRSLPRKVQNHIEEAKKLIKKLAYM